MDEGYDALIIGGGPAGGTAALRLARAGWSVALLERKAFPRRKVCGEYLSATNRPLLRSLGLEAVFDDQAGPPVRRVGLFARDAVLQAELPRYDNDPNGLGRALSREKLDTLLLDQARRAGAVIWQPATARTLDRDGSDFVCLAEVGGILRLLRAAVVIAAHGYWEPGTLPTQAVRTAPRRGDLLGFKAHFLGSDLPSGLMPLLAFPGGYGGMVHCDAGRVSLSCCVRRDRLTSIRQKYGGSAGEAVLAHIRASCRGVREALATAERDGDWLSAGPLRPGIRSVHRGGVFVCGNAAGEAHPVIAEGISMAMQSAWLLTERLIAHGRGREASAIAADYAADWRRCFAPRLRAASAFAHWAMRPTAVALSQPVLRVFPGLLAWGARLSGKATPVVTAASPD